MIPLGLLALLAHLFRADDGPIPERIDEVLRGLRTGGPTYKATSDSPDPPYSIGGRTVTGGADAPTAGYEGPVMPDVGGHRMRKARALVKSLWQRSELGADDILGVLDRRPGTRGLASERQIKHIQPSRSRL